jgi:radical SAM superfamily enzyme YgiQ (UPF0313 family)
VGFESLNPDSLKEANKGGNLPRVAQYAKLIKNAHKFGILVTAEFIVGFDNDSDETLGLTREFVEQSSVDSLRVHILQPIPGTGLYTKLEKEGRLYIGNYPEDWEAFARNFVLGINFEFAQLDPFTVKNWIIQTGRMFHSIPRITAKFFRILWTTKSFYIAMIIFITDWKSRKMFKSLEITRESVEKDLEFGKERQKDWKKRLGM